MVPTRSSVSEARLDSLVLVSYLFRCAPKERSPEVKPSDPETSKAIRKGRERQSYMRRRAISVGPSTDSASATVNAGTSVRREPQPKTAEPEPDHVFEMLDVTPEQLGLLDEAMHLGARLSASTDKLNLSLQRAEAALAKLNLGVSARVCLDFDQSGWQEDLVFGKTSSGWRLSVETSMPDGEWQPSPLLSSSRETRILAAEKLDELLRALIEAARKQLERIEGHADRADRFSTQVARQVER